MWEMVWKRKLYLQYETQERKIEFGKSLRLVSNINILEKIWSCLFYHFEFSLLLDYKIKKIFKNSENIL